MRYFIIDQLLFLTVGVVIMICIPIFCGPVSTYFFESIILLIWGYLCRRVVLIPFDYLLGKSTQIVCFSNQSGLYGYEFFKNKNCCEWKFYFGSGQTITLLVPDYSKDIPDKMFLPEKNQRIRITFLKLSKILLGWEPECE